jgi:hypothetical protein
MALLVLQSIVTSTRLHDLWGIPMGSFFGLAAVMGLQQRGFVINEVQVRRIVWGVVIAVPLIYGIVKSVKLGDGDVPSTSWPQAEISQRFEALWEAETKAPLKLVAGDALEAGLVALTAKHTPSLLIDMDMRRAPWVTADLIARDGILVIWQVTYKTGDEKLRPLTAGCVPKPLSFPYAGKSNWKPLVLYYCIIPPAVRK